MLFEIVLALFIVFVSRELWRRWKYDLHKVPSPPGFLLRGHTLEFTREAINNFPKWFRKHYNALGCPKILKFNIGNRTWVFVTDFACVKSVINNKTDPLPKHPTIIRNLISPIICNHGLKDTLFVTSNKLYARQIRRAYTNGLQASQLKANFPKVKQVMNEMLVFIESNRNDGPIDFQRLCVLFSLDTLGMLAFDTNLGGMDGSRGIYKEIIDIGHFNAEWMKAPLLSMYCNLFPNCEAAKRRMEKLSNLEREWNTLTEEILARPDPPPGETPIWYNLKTAIDPDTQTSLSFEMLRSEIATLVFAGMDTTGHQLSWILGMLAANPAVTEKLVRELQKQQLCGPQRREIEFSDLSNLPYLDAVIKEGFRVAYILRNGGLPRILPKDMTLLGYRLPKGVLVSCPGNRAMNTKADWGDPDVVRPERWLTKEDMSSKYFLMFGNGARDCIGQTLAMLEIRLVIITLLSKYHLSTNKTFSCLLENTLPGAVLECKGGMLLEVSPRNAEKCN